MKPILLLAFAALSMSTAAPARAGEVFGGILAHAVETPLSLSTGEGGADLELGFRAEPLGALKAIGSPSPYAFVSLNTAGDTDFIAAGLAWKIALGTVYLRPGVGISYNNGPARRVEPATRQRTDLGSRVLFEPEFGIGVAVGRNASLEASWVHISGARLFNGEQNPGIDMIGLRFNQRL